MKVHKIMDYCKYIETYGLYDHTASHYYQIQYEDNKVIIQLFNVYVIKNKKVKKYQETKIIDNISLKDFCNFIINVYEIKLHMGEYSDIELENIIKKIKIKKIE